MVKRVLSTLATVTILFSVMVVPASAVEVTGTYKGNTGFYWWSTSTGFNYQSMSTTNFSIPRSSSSAGIASDVSSDRNAPVIRDIMISPVTTSAVSGEIGVYGSVYYYVDGMTGTLRPMVDPSNINALLTYSNSNNVSGSASLELSTFTPAGHTGQLKTEGINFKANTYAEEYEPLSDLTVTLVGTQSDVECIFVYQQGGYDWTQTNHTLYMVIPSFTIISTRTSEELAGLENIADEIAAQSEILSAMYGDIISVCNSIYQRLGDMQATQELANSYFSQMVALLQSIDSNTENIYNLLAAQFTALKDVISSESSNLQAAISAQTAALIAYFNELYGVQEVPEDVTEQIQQGDKVQEDFDSLEKPDVDTVVPDLDNLVPSDGTADISVVLTKVFEAPLIITMMLISLSLAFVAYVLYGKR